MYAFSPRSRERLASCHRDLQLLFNTVIKDFDCTIVCGHRTREEQAVACRQGRSQTPWPNSKHNAVPSLAVDVAPYPIDWEDVKTFCLFAGWVLCTANHLYERGRISHRVRWGGDWDMDNDTGDNRFNDLVHYELLPVGAAAKE